VQQELKAKGSGLRGPCRPVQVRRSEAHVSHTQNRFSTAGSLGVYLAKRQLTVVQVAWSLGGLKPVALQCIPLDEPAAASDDGSPPPGPGAVLAAWLRSQFKPAQLGRLRVCVGLSPQQTYFTTCVLEEPTQELPPPHALLARSGVSGMGDAERTAAAGHMVRLGDGQIGCCLAACRRDLADEIHPALAPLGLKHFRLEPCAWSLGELAHRRCRGPRSWRWTVRVLLGGEHGLALLTCEGQSVLCRPFAVQQGPMASAATSAVRSLLAHARTHLHVREVGGLVLQGQADETLAREVQEHTGLEALLSSDEGPGEAALAAGLALSARRGAGEGLDLLTHLRAPPSIRQIFPRRLAACLLLAAALMAGLLWDRWTSLQRDAEVVARQNASRAWAASLALAQISDQRKALTGEVSAVHRFLSTRVRWSDYLRDLPTRLPPNACLSHVWGFCELGESNGKNKVKPAKSLTLRCLSRFGDRYSAPREIDTFLDSLSQVELLQRDFPLVKLADVKWARGADGESEMAHFTIIALPREKDVRSRKGGS